MDKLVRKVAAAIDSVQLFSRIDDWTSDAVKGYPVEVCRYGKDGEPEIVVVKRFPARTDESDALRQVVSEQRAIAAIEAMRL